MTKRLRSASALLAMVLLSSPAIADDWSNQQVGETQSDSRFCFFFTLAGNPQADPAVPGQPWFAIPTSNPNYQIMVSTILSGKLSGKAVHVRTDGTISCGYATVGTAGFQ